MRGAPTRTMMLRELLLALLVLALTALNFGHSSAVLAQGGRVVVTTTSSICGDPFAPNSGDHFACHACRPDLAVLPPPPAAAEPVCFAVAPVTYASAATRLPPAPPILSASPRGPPASI